MADDTANDDRLERARRGDGAALGALLEEQRAELRRQAERRLGQRVAVRVDASDIIQLTFLEAHRSLGQFRGSSARELRAWLEGILDHNVANAVRDHALLQKRDVRRELSMDDSQGAAPRPQDLVGGGSSPSHRLMRGEDEDRLLRALEGLADDQRLAVRLRHLNGWPLLEIAAHMGKTPAATAGLIKRGMQALRLRLKED